jgi:hypothetical protein
MLVIFRELYGAVRVRGAGPGGSVPSTRRELARFVHHTKRGGKLIGYHPRNLPAAVKLPAIASIFDPESDTTPRATCRALTLVGLHRRWLDTYGRAVYTDRHFPHVTTVNREMTRAISVSQFGSGAWLDGH